MFTVKTDASKVALRFDALPDALRNALGVEARGLASELADAARANAASFLRVISGDYAASIEQQTKVSPRSVSGKVFSRHPAAAILEFGGTIPPHEIAAKNANALHFIASQGEVFAKIVHSPGGKIKPHEVIHSAFASMQAEITAGLTQAAEGVLQGD